ncbi:MAG: hypothetical protein H5U03_09895, partial [Clostridia bacterium]|nr:hypothetical protein [Clostridia bacterium]
MVKCSCAAIINVMEREEMKLLPNLYYYLWPGTGNNCNTYLFAGEVLALVDPGHVANELNEPCYEMLAGHLRAD